MLLLDFHNELVKENNNNVLLVRLWDHWPALSKVNGHNREILILSKSSVYIVLPLTFFLFFNAFLILIDFGRFYSIIMTHNTTSSSL